MLVLEALLYIIIFNIILAAVKIIKKQFKFSLNGHIKIYLDCYLGVILRLINIIAIN